MNNGYKKAMDKITLSDESKRKILDKALANKNKKIQKMFYIKRVSGLAACLALVIISSSYFSFMNLDQAQPLDVPSSSDSISQTETPETALPQSESTPDEINPRPDSDSTNARNADGAAAPDTNAAPRLQNGAEDSSGSSDAGRTPDLNASSPASRSSVSGSSAATSDGSTHSETVGSSSILESAPDPGSASGGSAPIDETYSDDSESSPSPSPSPQTTEPDD